MRNGSAPEPAAGPRIQFTRGAGVRQPVGQLVSVPADHRGPVVAVRDEIAAMGPGTEAWIAAGLFKANHRAKNNWLACDLLAVDVDYQDQKGEHIGVPEEVANRVENSFEDSRMPGSLAHLTPRGFRVLFVLEVRDKNRRTALDAMKGAGALIDSALAEAGLLAADAAAGFAVDGATLELARLVFTPNAIVDGARRDGELVLLRDECYGAGTLAELAPAEAASVHEPRKNGRPIIGIGTPGRVGAGFAAAAERWNADHPISDLPRSGGACPVCLHEDCFGELPDRPGHWACFSKNHQKDAIHRSLVDAGCGRELQDYKGSGFGDALDIEAWRRRYSPREVLLFDGYLLGAEGVFDTADSDAEHRRPRIMVREGELRDAITQTEDALIAAEHLPPVFQRGDQLVRIVEFDDPTELRRGVELPAHTPVLERIQPVYLRTLFEQSAEFWKFKSNGELCRTRCPADVVSGYQQSTGLWRVRKLRAVIQAPTLRADGTVLQVPG